MPPPQQPRVETVLQAPEQPRSRPPGMCADGRVAESLVQGPFEVGAESDASGLTREEKLEYLLAAHDRLLACREDAPARGRSHSELMFAARCVATIMRENGLADYGDPAELEIRGGFSLRPSAPNEWVFAADRARFRFMKGDFPAYDSAKTRRIRVLEGQPLSAPTPELRGAYDALYLEALASLGVSHTSDK